MVLHQSRFGSSIEEDVEPTVEDPIPSSSHVQGRSGCLGWSFVVPGSSWSGGYITLGPCMGKFSRYSEGVCSLFYVMFFDLFLLRPSVAVFMFNFVQVWPCFILSRLDICGFEPPPLWWLFIKWTMLLCLKSSCVFIVVEEKNMSCHLISNSLIDRRISCSFLDEEFWKVWFLQKIVKVGIYRETNFLDLVSVRYYALRYLRQVWWVYGKT